MQEITAALSDEQATDEHRSNKTVVDINKLLEAPDRLAAQAIAAHAAQFGARVHQQANMHMHAAPHRLPAAIYAQMPQQAPAQAMRAYQPRHQNRRR